MLGLQRDVIEDNTILISQQLHLTGPTEKSTSLSSMSDFVGGAHNKKCPSSPTIYNITFRYRPVFEVVNSDSFHYL